MSEGKSSFVSQLKRPRRADFSLVRGSTILQLEAGKIRRESDHWDAATFMKQVGAQPKQRDFKPSSHT